MAEETPQIQVTLSLPYAILLKEWLSHLDSAAALSMGCAPLTDLGAKLALDHLAEQMSHNYPVFDRGQWPPKVAAARARVEEDRRQSLLGLINVLLDPTIDDIGGRDDCAMFLGDFDDDEAFDALLRVATDPGEDDTITGSAGESLGEILRRRPREGFDAAALMPPARREFEAIMRRGANETLD